jgi:ABC-type antimicrobial peptide transport system permease subunit
VPQLYVSYRQQSEPNIALVVRTVAPAPLPLAAIKQAIWSVDARQAVFGVTTLESQLSSATASHRAIAALTGGFAVLALLTSLAGIYTIVSYLVSRRVKEIAVRRAIGATSADVIRSLVQPTLAWTMAGLAAGAGGGVAAVGLLRAALTGVVPVDVAVTAATLVPYLLVVLAVLAAASRAALRIDPAAALRAD